MQKIRKLLCLYVAMALLVTNTCGVSLAVALPDSKSRAIDILSLDSTRMSGSTSRSAVCDPNDPNSRCARKSKNQGKGTHGNQQAGAEGEEEEEGGCSDGSCDGGGGGGSGGGSGGGGGLGGMLGQMMQSLLPLLMMMMMMQQNKNNQQQTPAALATVPPTFTPIQLLTAVPTATKAPTAISASSANSNSESALFPTLPPMN